MRSDDSFRVYVETELLRNVIGISIRRMFDGYGIYRHSVFIGLIHDGMLYFKVDDGNRKDYEEAGSRPFVYVGHKGKSVTLSFWEVPSTAMDNAEAIVEWVEAAYAASLRSKAK